MALPVPKNVSPLFCFGELQLAIDAQLSTGEYGKRCAAHGHDHDFHWDIFAGAGS
jgi:hypothetical protein